VRYGIAEGFEFAVRGAQLRGVLLQLAGGAFFVRHVAGGGIHATSPGIRDRLPAEPPMAAVLASIPILEVDGDSPLGQPG
jgi:hypothetical protein